MNNSITFIDEGHIKDSILYEPVKSIAPILFPNIIKAEEEETETPD